MTNIKERNNIINNNFPKVDAPVSVYRQTNLFENKQ